MQKLINYWASWLSITVGIAVLKLASFDVSFGIIGWLQTYCKGVNILPEPYSLYASFLLFTILLWFSGTLLCSCWTHKAKESIIAVQNSLLAPWQEDVHIKTQEAINISITSRISILEDFVCTSNKMVQELLIQLREIKEENQYGKNKTCCSNSLSKENDIPSVSCSNSHLETTATPISSTTSCTQGEFPGNLSDAFDTAVSTIATDFVVNDTAFCGNINEQNAVINKDEEYKAHNVSAFTDGTSPVLQKKIASVICDDCNFIKGADAIKCPCCGIVKRNRKYCKVKPVCSGDFCTGRACIFGSRISACDSEAIFSSSQAKSSLDFGSYFSKTKATVQSSTCYASSITTSVFDIHVHHPTDPLVSCVTVPTYGLKFNIPKSIDETISQTTCENLTEHTNTAAKVTPTDVKKSVFQFGLSSSSETRLHSTIIQKVIATEAQRFVTVSEPNVGEHEGYKFSCCMPATSSVSSTKLTTFTTQVTNVDTVSGITFAMPQVSNQTSGATISELSAVSSASFKISILNSTSAMDSSTSLTGIIGTPSTNVCSIANFGIGFGTQSLVACCTATSCLQFGISSPTISGITNSGICFGTPAPISNTISSSVLLGIPPTMVCSKAGSDIQFGTPTIPISSTVISSVSLGFPSTKICNKASSGIQLGTSTYFSSPVSSSVLLGIPSTNACGKASSGVLFVTPTSSVSSLVSSSVSFGIPSLNVCSKASSGIQFVIPTTSVSSPVSSYLSFGFSSTNAYNKASSGVVFCTPITPVPCPVISYVQLGFPSANVCTKARTGIQSGTQKSSVSSLVSSSALLGIPSTTVCSKASSSIHFGTPTSSISIPVSSSVSFSFSSIKACNTASSGILLGTPIIPVCSLVSSSALLGLPSTKAFSKASSGVLFGTTAVPVSSPVSSSVSFQSLSLGTINTTKLSLVCVPQTSGSVFGTPSITVSGTASVGFGFGTLSASSKFSSSILSFKQSDQKTTSAKSTPCFEAGSGFRFNVPSASENNVNGISTTKDFEPKKTSQNESISMIQPHTFNQIQNNDKENRDKPSKPDFADNVQSGNNVLAAPQQASPDSWKSSPQPHVRGLNPSNARMLANVLRESSIQSGTKCETLVPQQPSLAQLPGPGYFSHNSHAVQPDCIQTAVGMQEQLAAAITSTSSHVLYKHPEEYEPNIVFKPVIQLPELIEVRTGEEEEEKLFCEKARLFHFDEETRTWKERGVGKLKILKHDVTKNVRILMRRDQVLKLCANHKLTADMKLTKMSLEDKAWTWNAVDFAEGETKCKTFSARFKNQKIAENFKSVFEKCQAELSQCQRDDTANNDHKKVEDKAMETSLSGKCDLALMFKQKPGSWNCNSCFVNNGSEILNCLCCGLSKPGVKSEHIKPVNSAGTKGLTSGFVFAPQTTHSIFETPSTMVRSIAASGFKYGTPVTVFENFQAELSHCQQDDTEEMVKAKVEGKVVETLIFKQKPGSWKCSVCYENNGAEILKCHFCGSSKPGVQSEHIKPMTSTGTQGLTSGSPAGAGSVFKFGSLAPALNTSSGFKFNSTTAIFSIFGAPTTTVKPSSLSTFNTAKSGFVLAPQTTHSVFDVPTTVVDGTSGSGFKFGTPITAPKYVSSFQTSQDPISLLGSKNKELDNDVIIVKVETASNDQIAKARELMLPDHFYLYTKKPPCPGCRGCEDGEPIYQTNQKDQDYDDDKADYSDHTDDSDEEEKTK